MYDDDEEDADSRGNSWCIQCRAQWASSQRHHHYVFACAMCAPECVCVYVTGRMNPAAVIQRAPYSRAQRERHNVAYANKVHPIAANNAACFTTPLPRPPPTRKTPLTHTPTAKYNLFTAESTQREHGTRVLCSTDFLPEVARGIPFAFLAICISNSIMLSHAAVAHTHTHKVHNKNRAP